MIHREDREECAVLRFEHGKANALDVEFLGALDDRLAELEGGQPIVLTGTGSIFSAGVDLFRILDGGADYLAAFLPALSRTIERLFSMPQPIVAAVNGHAIAGGCILAAAADRRAMADGSGRIGVPELLVGVPFPTAILEVLRSLVGTRAARELIYTGSTLDPRAAAEIGLVDEVVAPDELLDRCAKMAASLGALPAESFAITKRQLRRPVLDLIERHADPVDAQVARQWGSPEAQRRIRDYMERTVKKRPG